VLGAIFGGFIFRIIGLTATNVIGSLITSTLGAILVLYLLAQYGRRL
jgi:uncharacterized membrane protein YeaQ/YmgE (transglycosylase-associated protein family)